MPLPLDHDDPTGADVPKSYDFDEIIPGMESLTLRSQTVDDWLEAASHQGSKQLLPLTGSRLNVLKRVKASVHRALDAQRTLRARINSKSESFTKLFSSLDSESKSLPKFSETTLGLFKKTWNDTVSAALQVVRYTRRFGELPKLTAEQVLAFDSDLIEKSRRIGEAFKSFSGSGYWLD